jgi:hypothetical protein
MGILVPLNLLLQEWNKGVDSLEPVRQKVRAAKVTNPPAPWSLAGSVAIGGLTEVGFAENSDLLLVLSSQGRGVIDCMTGQKVARDHSVDETEAWYGSNCLIGTGFGPLEGKQVWLSGIVGGGLPVITKGGWSVERLQIDWPDECLLLLEPFSSIYRADAGFTKLVVEREVRAFGFSFSGRSLVIATSSYVTIYCRK